MVCFFYHCALYVHIAVIVIIVVVIDGWDICIDNIGDAMRKSKVLDITLQDQVYDKLSQFTPRPSIYDSDFIAANQVCSSAIQHTTK